MCVPEVGASRHKCMLLYIDTVLTYQTLDRSTDNNEFDGFVDEPGRANQAQQENVPEKRHGFG